MQKIQVKRVYTLNENMELCIKDTVETVADIPAFSIEQALEQALISLKLERDAVKNLQTTISKARCDINDLHSELATISKKVNAQIDTCGNNLKAYNGHVYVPRWIIKVKNDMYLERTDVAFPEHYWMTKHSIRISNVRSGFSYCRIFIDRCHAMQVCETIIGLGYSEAKVEEVMLPF